MSPFLYRSRLQWEGYHGVAAIADDAINRGRSCERSYDSLTQGDAK